MIPVTECIKENVNTLSQELLIILTGVSGCLASHKVECQGWGGGSIVTHATM